MKKWVLAAMCAALVACNEGENGSTNVIQNAQAEDKAASSLTTEDQKASYAIGLRYGEGFARDLKEIDLAVFYKGLQDGFKGTPPQMKPEEIGRASCRERV